MKKLMIAAAIVCAAVVGQASSFTWNAATAFVVTPGAATPMEGISGTAYLFALTGAEALSQAEMLEAVRGGSSVASLAADLGADPLTVSGGNTTATSTAFTYDQGAQTFYAVFVDSSAPDRIFISSTVPATGTIFDAPTDFSLNNEFMTSKGGVSDGDYSAAGWYTASAVPEPTSGLLLLLGVAGLALRRRRA